MQSSSEIKSILYPPACFVSMLTNEQSLMATFRTGSQPTVLVSVLDLDNSVRFSRDIHNAARKHRVTYLLHLSFALRLLNSIQNQTEIIATLGAIKQCCLLLEIALKVTCISLYDVNSSRLDE